MAKRKTISKKKSGKLFSKTSGAKSTKNRNFKVAPMRGGYRL